MRCTGSKEVESPAQEEPSKGELEETAAELLLWMSDKSYSTNIHFFFPHPFLSASFSFFFLYIF